MTPRSDQSGPSAWLWLVLGLLVLGGAGVVFARRHSARSRAGADD